MKKYWKTWILLILLLCLCGSMIGCGGGDSAEGSTKSPAVSGPAEPLTIWVATDLHYLSEELYDDSPILVKTLQQGDGKLTEHMPQILDIFVDQVLTARPDALVLAGDLTFNGERLSLEELAEKLAVIQEAGIPVLVIPGNHDAGHYTAVSYLNNALGGTEMISVDTFRQICGGFGYDQAASRDEASFSYVYDLTEDVQLMMLDANLLDVSIADQRGTLIDATLTWMEEQLAAAQKAGKTVLTVTHQNVLPQNALLYYGFALYNYEEVSALLQKYGVTVNVSGHSHIQHLSQAEDLKDYATGPLSVTPLRYGVLTVDEERQIRYEMASLIEPRPEDADVLTVSEAAKELAAAAVLRYDECQRRQVTAALEEIQQRNGFTDEEQEIMTEFVVEVNRAYFAGELSGKQEYLNREGWALWTRYCKEDFWWHYTYGILTEP